MKIILNIIVRLLQSLLFIIPCYQFVVAQENIFPRMIGKWRDINNAFTIIVEADGTVFSDNEKLAGAVERTIDGGGNFAFEGKSVRCSYNIVFLGAPLEGASSWGLKASSKDDICFKTGIFVKVDDGNLDRRNSVREAPRKEKSNHEKITIKNECQKYEYIDIYFAFSINKSSNISWDTTHRRIAYNSHYYARTSNNKYIYYGEGELYARAYSGPAERGSSNDSNYSSTIWPDSGGKGVGQEEINVNGERSIYQKITTDELIFTCE